MVGQVVVKRQAKVHKRLREEDGAAPVEQQVPNIVPDVSPALYVSVFTGENTASVLLRLPDAQMRISRPKRRRRPYIASVQKHQIEIYLFFVLYLQTGKGGSWRSVANFEVFFSRGRFLAFGKGYTWYVVIQVKMGNVLWWLLLPERYRAVLRCSCCGYEPEFPFFVFPFARTASRPSSAAVCWHETAFTYT
jgi:hypothetical protein